MTPEGQRIIVKQDGTLRVPDAPVILFIEGDGIGPEVWRAARLVLDAAVATAFGGEKKIAWQEVLAGEKAFAETGQWLPQETLDAISAHAVAIKGPLTTPVGGGIRSVNVALRQALDLYACVRPVKHIAGVPSPMKNPRALDVVVFRENTEDVYAGIEWPAFSQEAVRLREFLEKEMGTVLPLDAGIGIKPISEKNTRRLVRRAVAYALDHDRASVTLMHKGNIMKFTEGAFRAWGYDEARSTFGDRTLTEAELLERHGGKRPKGKVVIQDRIADSMFQQVLLRPDEYSVIAAPNLNGDYISDALAAQAGGLGMAPGANIGDACAVFEATHGTAPKHAGLDRANPGSLILSGAMLLEHIGWGQAADRVTRALAKTIADGVVTYDLARLMPGARGAGCAEFGLSVAERV